MSGSRYISNFEKVDMSVDYNLDDAIEMLKNFKSTRLCITASCLPNCIAQWSS